MAPALFESSSSKYKDRVPQECFLSKLPDWLRPCSDNVVSPSHDLTADGNIKYIRASKYREFVMACQTFGNLCLSDAASKPIELRVIIMPYMPLRDAYLMHQLILEPDLLPDTFEDASKSPCTGDKAEGDGMSLDLGLERLMDQQVAEDEDEEEDEDAALAKWEVKKGSVSVNELGYVVDFVVMNYSFLWSKAEMYCNFMFLSDPLKDFLGRLRLFDKLVHKPPEEFLHVFNENLERARKQLIFAMYLNALDPHDIINSFYPYVHERVYLDCVRCKSDGAENGDDVDESPQTMERLFQELNALGLQQFDPSINVESAQHNLMKHEGFLEEFLLKSGSMKSFTRTEEQFRTTVQFILQNLSLVSSMVIHDD